MSSDPASGAIDDAESYSSPTGGDVPGQLASSATGLQNASGIQPPGTPAPSSQQVYQVPSTISAPAFALPQPTMGVLVAVDVNKHQIRVGFVPNAAWTGIDPKAKHPAPAPGQMRPLYGDAKNSYYRVLGLDDKLQKGGDVKAFQLQVAARMMKNGHYTIAHLPGKQQPNKMFFIVHFHGQYTVDDVKQLVKPQVLLYDDQDQQNDNEAKEFLLNSLSSDLKKDLNRRIQENDVFPVVWKRLMYIVRTTSVYALDDTRKKIENRIPQHYPGQNIADFCADNADDCQELDQAGHFPWTLLLRIVTNALRADGGDEYKDDMRPVRIAVKNALGEIGYMDPSAAEQYMINNKLTFQDILSTAEDSYRSLKDRGMWPPARSNKDSKRPPESYGKLATAPELNALVQQQNGTKGKAKPDDICLNCGDKGHWSRECPKKEPLKPKPRQQRKNNKHQSQRKTNWKRIPPADGEPTTKTERGQPWHWCAHCGRWSTTHGTAGHTGPKPNKPPADPSANLLFQTPEPYAWIGHVPDAPTDFNVDFEIPLIPTLIATWCFLRLLVVYGVLRLAKLRFIVGSILSYFIGVYNPTLPATIYNAFAAAATAFSCNWFSLAAPILWLCLFILPLLPTHWLHWFLRIPPDPDPVRNYTVSPVRMKQFRRHYKRHLPSRRRHPLTSRRIVDKIQADRRRSNVYEAIERVMHFADAISFRRVRREGDNWSKKKSKKDRWKKKNLDEKDSNPYRNFRKTPKRYRPTCGHGIPDSHFNMLFSPAAKAYILHAEIPPHLSQVFESFKAAASLVGENAGRKENKFAVIWDSGASISISSNRNDFVGPLKPAPAGLKIKGLAKGLRIAGIGHVAWTFIDETGMLRTLKLPAYYVPSADVRLLSTTSLLQAYPNESIQMTEGYLRLSGCKESATNSILVGIHPRSNLHVSYAYVYGKEESSAESECKSSSEQEHRWTYHSKSPEHKAHAHNFTTTSEANHNLSPAAKELLKWHYRLAHLDFKKVQFLLRTGVLAHTESARRIQAAASKLTSFPMCAACQFGKQRRKPAPGKLSRKVRDREGVLKQDNLFPGQKVSVDHFNCSTKGRLLHTFGKEDPSTQFCGGAIFVDHASGYVFVEHQVHLNTHETLKAKESFESHLRDFGVVVSEYMSDNGSAFTSDAYRAHLEEFQQIQYFAGVGAHHHNGIAERSIQTVMSIARTMLLHQAIHWPDVADPTLWALAVDHAVFLYNHMPNPSNGLSPHDLLSRSRWPQSKLADCHVWGCPVYVLDKTIQDGKKLPRWQPRSTRQIYVGMSKKHASSVPLCLNPSTGAITPQFHIVFDDDFTTIATSIEDLPDFGSDEWMNLFGDSSYQYVLDDDAQAESNSEDASADDDAPPPLIDRVRAQQETLRPPEPLQVAPPPTVPKSEPSSSLQREQPVELPIQREPTPPSSFEKSPSPPPSAPPPVSTPSLPQREIVGATTPKQAPTPPPKAPTPPPKVPTPQPKAPPPAPTRRSTRINKSKPPKRLGFDGKGVAGYFFKPDHKEPSSFLDYFAAFNASGLQDETIDINDAYLRTAFKARATKDPDTLSYNEAMKSKDKEKWDEAALNEIRQLESKGAWVEVPMSEAKTKILPGTWVFRVKRNPSGEIKKYKARYCVRGDLEEVDEDEDYFAPTVAWSTVRLFLVLCLILGWATISIDFSNAFIQSKLDKPMWIHLPRGFRSNRGPGTCLRLIKSVYGGRRSPALWHRTAIDGFKKCGFAQSKFDPCLLYKSGMMVVLYVDDAGIGAADPADIDKLIQQLRDLGFELKKEGDFNEFLGIKLEKREDGSVELTQTGLIDKILEATNMTDCNPNRIPATGALGSDPDGPPMEETWNYRSVVGMLMYLSTNTRCDITFAVSQVARFSANPKQSHATAVKTILRYLKRTRTKGMIIKITGLLHLDLFVDADFCGLYKIEPDTDPNSARSRTGFIVKLSDCPLTWRSQLQTSITCSTMEAEYNALSTGLRTLLPLKRMLQEAAQCLNISSTIASTIRARAFEDNQGAYFLANNQRITNRTRFYNNRWHWFWQFVNKDGSGDGVAVRERDTSEQDGDYLTKALTVVPFEDNRFRVQKW